jgi:hypothetical protein
MKFQLLLFWFFLSGTLGNIIKDKRNPSARTKKSEAYTVVPDSRHERLRQNQLQIRNTKHTRNRIDKDALEELEQDHTPLNRDNQGDVPQRLRVDNSVPSRNRPKQGNDIYRTKMVNSHSKNLRVDTTHDRTPVSRSDITPLETGDSNPEILPVERDSHEADNRDDTPVYRDQLTQFKKKNSNHKQNWAEKGFPKGENHKTGKLNRDDLIQLLRTENAKRNKLRMEKQAAEAKSDNLIKHNNATSLKRNDMNSNPKKHQMDKQAAEATSDNFRRYNNTSWKRNDASSNPKKPQMNKDANAPPTDHRNRSPVYRDEMTRLKNQNSKTKKATNSRNHVSLPVPDDLALANETIRLIYSLLGNSTATYINTTQAHNSTGFYHHPSQLESTNDTTSYLEDMNLIKNISLLTNPNNETHVILNLMPNSSTSNVNVHSFNTPIRFYRPSLLEYANDTASYIEDMKLIKNISLLTNPNNETRVISFALYGKKPKYNLGAIYNVEMAKVYFPGWKCRFYVTNDVLNLTISVLKDLGADIEYIPPGMGKMSGMFWRFVVADDPTVDRYIIRDVDSRPNARDR